MTADQALDHADNIGADDDFDTPAREYIESGGVEGSYCLFTNADRDALHALAAEVRRLLAEHS